MNDEDILDKSSWEEREWHNEPDFLTWIDP